MTISKQHLVFLVLTVIFMLIGSFFVSKVPLTPQLAQISAINMVVLALPAFWGVVKSLGWKKGIALITSLGIFALFIESLAIATGWPYGEFNYNELLGAKILGLTPWTVAFAWSPLVIGCYALARTLNPNSQFFLIITTTLLLVITDLILDPGAVALKFWEWEVPGIYYEVPIINYFGWIISGIIGSFITYSFTKNIVNTNQLWLLSLTLSVIFWTGVAFWFVYWIPFGIGIIFSVLLLKQLISFKN